MPAVTKEELSSLLPHAGAMRLIDRVESWDDTMIRCRAWSHRDPTNPLRHGASLDVVAGVEYAAQAMGLHVGLRDRGWAKEGSIGYVGSLRDVVFGVGRLDDCRTDLTIDAIRLFDDDQGFVYRFAITSEGRELLRGRASIFLKQVRS
jgi:predicted hotdog family 3-hydroxylacyl-ACP dehydratase